MASIVVSGDTSGAITIAAPAVAGTNTLTLPASTGTLVVTGGAQTIEFADGSASAPSITNSGDTNTGMFFPAADTIAFTEGGTESMRIDSVGNVGIGTASPTARLGLPVPEFTSSVTNGMVRFQNPNVSADGCIQSYYVSGAGTDIYIGANSYIDTGGSTARFSNSYATAAVNIRRDGSINFLTNTSGGNASNRMTLTSDGLLQFNSGYGSVATAYGCRAWVNFNGTGTVAIRASGNVSSITDNGTGDYTANFTNAMPDGNYVLSGTAMFPTSVNDHFIGLGDTNGAAGTLPSTTAVRFRTMYNNAANFPQDCTYVTIMIVR